jgi:tetratricopeptide (TPR) repeat protein
LIRGALNRSGVKRRTSLSGLSSKYSLTVRALSLCCLLLIAPLMVAGQYNDEPLAINQGPEAQFLELVDLVAEPAKQLELLDTFIGRFPRYAAMSTIHAQRQEIFVTLRQWDQALDVGNKLLALDESDIETVRRNLKAAEGKGDAELIAKWSARLKQLEPPEGEVTVVSSVRLPFVDDIPDDLAAVDLGSIPKQHKNRVEAFLFNRALEEKDPVRKLQLLSVFEKQFPASSHLSKVRYLFYLTHLQRQDHVKALAAAEAVLERDKSREDVVFYAAQNYFVTRKSPEKVLTLSALLLDLAQSKPKPEEMTDEAWQKQKTLMTSQAHWMIGSTHFQHQRWAESDKALRAALAISPAKSELTEMIVLNLGWVNYKLRNIDESLKFYRQCVAMHGANQATAAQSIVSIKAEYQIP